MNALPVCFFFCLIIFSAVVKGHCSGPDLVLATIPWQDEKSLQSVYAPLVDLLQRKLSRSVRLRVADKYNEVEELLDHRLADIAILGGNAYVEAKEKQKGLRYLVTCKQPDPYYYSLILTHHDSPIRQLADLQGKSFGYTDSKSTSGYVFPRLMIIEAGLNAEDLFARVYFLNKHDKVYEAVAKGVIDAGAASETLWNEAIRHHGHIFRVIQKSDPIPRNAVVAGAHMSASQADQIAGILQDAEHDQRYSQSQTPLKGFIALGDHYYDIIRRAKRHGLE